MLKKAVRRVCPDVMRYVYHNLRNRHYARSRMGGGYDIKAVEIETVNRCNGTCPFCPVNVNQPQRPYAKMSEELFRKIIDDLAGMNYANGIALFSNNEPFLDERIIDFHRYANEKLPRAIFHLYTNGSLLTFEKFIALMPYLDLLIIDNYNDKKEINTPELRRIYDYLQTDEEMSRRVNFCFRLQNEVLTSRGGQAPNKQGNSDRRALNVVCALPFRQLIIRPTGEISLCCNDPLGKYTLGNLNTQTISEVWNSEQYRAIRMDMMTNARKNLMLCCDCDSMFGLGLYTERKRL